MPFPRSYYLEAVIWTAGLAYLALLDPASPAPVTLCPLHHLGFEHCPGCGLGRSVSYLFHGDLAGSFSMHLLGIPAVVIIIHRIVSIVRRPFIAAKTGQPL